VQGKLCIDFAVDGAKRMEALLTGLREYWSVDKEWPVYFPPCNTEEIIDHSVAHLQSIIEETGTVITRDPLPIVRGEKYSLQLLFQNLIANAIKYRQPDTPARIHISAEKVGTMWQFSVADNGIGIESDHLEVIFAPFKRLHGANYPGSGLGLAMCQKVVERYRGRIWAESTVGQGSTFRVQLPADVR
jgi:signal transduction histidine kinase